MADHFSNARTVRDNLVKRLLQGVLYNKSWGAEFAASEGVRALEKLKAEIPSISVSSFTEDQCDDLDFGRWDHESGLRLLPVWMYPFLHLGDIVTSITGEDVTVSEGYDDIERFSEDGPRIYISNDNRFGCLAYGIVPTKASA